MAIEIVDLVSKIYEQGDTLTARSVPGHREVMGSEIADTCSEGKDNRQPESEGDGTRQPGLSQKKSGRGSNQTVEEPYP